MSARGSLRQRAAGSSCTSCTGTSTSTSTSTSSSPSPSTSPTDSTASTGAEFGSGCCMRLPERDSQYEIRPRSSHRQFGCSVGESPYSTVHYWLTRLERSVLPVGPQFLGGMSHRVETQSERQNQSTNQSIHVEQRYGFVVRLSVVTYWDGSSRFFIRSSSTIDGNGTFSALLIACVGLPSPINPSTQLSHLSWPTWLISTTRIFPNRA